MGLEERLSLGDKLGSLEGSVLGEEIGLLEGDEVRPAEGSPDVGMLGFEENFPDGDELGDKL